MRVCVLGPVEVHDDQGLVEVAGTRVRRLLVRLAVDAPRPVSIAELEDAVWYDGDLPRQAGNALQTLVSRLRRALGSPEAVQQVPTGYRLSGRDVDVIAFERAARLGHERLVEDDFTGASQSLGDALRLWRGEPLVDAGDADYAVALRVRLAELRLEARCDLIDVQLVTGKGPSRELIAELEEMAAAMPLRERVTGQLMRGLVAADRAPEALTAFARLRARLADELGADPSQALQDLHVTVLRGEPATATPAPRPMLRAALTSFVGRADELKRIHELLSSGRLTTVVGPGGAGKTRLAAEAARTWTTPRRWDGDWLVELAPITDEHNLVQAFLTALGVREARLVERPTERPMSRDPLTRLLDSLHDVHGLLVVDNCEHLIDPVARLVARLLATAPHLRVLATSREPLGIDGESLCVVPPLALPNADSSPEQAMAFPAVQLLVDRAAAVRADFEVSVDNVDSVVEIVRRLDGLPLAIELAAARLRVLPVAEVAARLSDRFRLLTGGDRSALPRHRTLRAVVEWSWDLLSVQERLLAERLSVFPAGASATSAQAVCAGSGLDQVEVLDLLDQLVDKSLLQLSEEDGLRYRMLETIREYGVERLAERDEVAAVRRAHALHYASVVADAAPRLRGLDQLPAFATIEREYDNVIGGLRFLGDTGSAAEAVTLAIDLSWYWMLRNEHADAAGWLAFACAVPGAERLHLFPLAEAGMVLNELASAGAFDTFGSPDALERLDQVRRGLADLTGLEPRLEAERILLLVGSALFAQADGDVAPLLEAGLASPDRWTRAAIRMLSAAVAENRGDLERMRVDVAVAVAEFRELGDRWGLASTLSSFAYLQTMDGDLSAARAAYEEAAGLMEELGAREDSGFLRLRLAGLCLRQEDPLGAREHVRVVVERFRGRSDAVTTFAHALLAAVAGLEGDLATMRRLRADVDAQLDETPTGHPIGGHGRAIALATIAQLYADDGDLQAAARCIGRAYPAALGTQDQPIIAIAGVGVATLAAALDQPETAARILGACAVLRGGDDPTEPTVRRLTVILREALRDRFDVAYDAGKALSHDDAKAAVSPSVVEGLTAA